MNRLAKASVAIIGSFSIGAAALLGLAPTSGNAHAEAVATMLPPRQAETLIAATTGPQAAVAQAVGKDAQLINASLAFSGAPVQAASAFTVADSSLDHRRALLCLTQAVYYEAANEPMTGRRAVAQVVLNRMRHPAYQIGRAHV